MTDFNFNIDQIKAIYQAGIRRGNDEATAYEHGSYSTGSEYDNCVEAIHEIVNVDKGFADSDYVTYDVIESWFAK
jgi:hypothetical protein